MSGCGDGIKVDDEQCEKNAPDAQFCGQSCTCNDGTITNNSTSSFCEYISSIITDPPKDANLGGETVAVPVNIVVSIVVCGAAASKY